MRGSHLSVLESEAISIFWKAASFRNPHILFSGGKDSIVMVHLAIKAFYPSPIPFSLLHIDTGHNFPETITFRDAFVQKNPLKLIVKKVSDTIAQKKIAEPQEKLPSRNAIQSITLTDAIADLQIDCCIGGGRRDEDKARAKERIFSKRSDNGGWNPYQQEPEFWREYNTHLSDGEHMRVFPISNFTELDIWNYIKQHDIALPSIYFAHWRPVFEYNSKLIAQSPFITLDETDTLFEKKVRYRTVGDMTCTAAIASEATTIDAVIAELQNTHISERGETRIDDQFSTTALGDRKRNGYF